MNPFKMLFQKSSSPWLLSLSNNFESSLIERLKNLIPENKAEILTLQWMNLAIESLCDTHNDINILFTDLNLHIINDSERHQYCLDVYMDLTKTVLDLCNAFNFQLHRISHCNFGLKLIRQDLELEPEEQCIEIRSILDSWRQNITEENPEIDTILGEFVESLNFRKVKTFEEGKVFMKALYAANVFTVYISSVVATVLSNSDKGYLNISVSKEPLWKEAFLDLQTIVNGEIRDALSSDGTMVLEELECVDAKVKKMDLLVQDSDDLVEECYEECVMELKEEVEKLDNGFDKLSVKIQNLFSVTLKGRSSIVYDL